MGYAHDDRTTPKYNQECHGQKASLIVSIFVNNYIKIYIPRLFFLFDPWI